MNIEKGISLSAIAAVKELYGQDVPEKIVQLQKTKPGFEGNLTLVVFPFLKMSHKKPQDTAQEIGEKLVSNCKAVAAFDAVGGFLNLVIAPKAWLGLLDDIDRDPRYGEKAATKESPLVMVEYSSPNTNKPLHLGHVRNNLLGWSLAKILEANGNRVVKTNIVNDRGIHIMRSMLAWIKWGNGCTPESTVKKGDYLIGDFYMLFDKHYKEECTELEKKYIAEGMNEDDAKKKAEQEAPLIKEAHHMLVKWEAGDKEIRDLWAKMNAWVYAGFDETYRALGVSFDKIYYESNTYLEGKRKVMEGLRKGLFYQKEDGSIWADLTKDGLDQKLLIRSDGTTVYMTQDIGTAEMRFNDYPIDKIIYVVGNEQNCHFQVLSILLDRLGFKWGKDLVHFSYGMVELPNGKMKSREGTVVDADDLIDTMISDARKTSEEHGQSKEFSEAEKQEIARIVGLGALKYFILKVDARKNMLFNPAESIDFNGNTGPFIQYTYARIQSILRKSQDNVTDSATGYAPNIKEVELIQKLDAFKMAVADAGQNYNPAGIANYTYELTKLFNQFCHDYSILSADTDAEKSFRLKLARNVGKTIKNAMELLGIEVPERM
ncbi:arginine--tRNA ligase [Hallella multisaccharivorax DSM 17128]|uniref:Arginine--tRNA ligase n=1 Tax=Hallella multisaccharivorax DSM 17128 TaxID=688246 RepID=F8N8V5_9BACT|nr:arginine--tRNA ligase [Hallella multisaccharivorax]EGN55600.1 arginyl-tRNA synthetase [Hallella multisaccharivorax DSM 17128]GJG29148.1 arginine--tRNA ligase [Hallella multisaccharivorax DSM 17128]